MTFAKLFANWVVPEKFKCSPLIPVCRLVIFVLSTISVFNWRRWFVSWLTVKSAFPSSDLTVGVEIATLQSGTCSLTNFFQIQQLIQNHPWSESFSVILSSMDNQMARFLSDYWREVMLHILHIRTWEMSDLYNMVFLT